MGVQSLGQEDPLEESVATHSSVLACRLSGSEEPGRLQSMGSQSPTRLHTHTHTHTHARTRTHTHTHTRMCLI